MKGFALTVAAPADHAPRHPGDVPAMWWRLASRDWCGSQAAAVPVSALCRQVRSSSLIPGTRSRVNNPLDTSCGNHREYATHLVGTCPPPEVGRRLPVAPSVRRPAPLHFRTLLQCVQSLRGDSGLNACHLGYTFGG